MRSLPSASMECTGSTRGASCIWLLHRTPSSAQDGLDHMTMCTHTDLHVATCTVWWWLYVLVMIHCNPLCVQYGCVRMCALQCVYIQNGQLAVHQFKAVYLSTCVCIGLLLRYLSDNISGNCQPTRSLKTWSLIH